MSHRSPADLRSSIAVGIMIAVLIVHAPASPASESNIVKGVMLASADGYAPDTEVRIALVATIDSKWHINSNTPSSEFLIPAQLTCKDHSKVKTEEVIYPNGHGRKFSFADEPLSVYDGRVVVYARGQVSGEAEPGSVELSCSFSYQACNDRSCQPPSSLDLPLQVVVFEPGSQGKPTHEKLFAGFPGEEPPPPSVCGR